VRSPALPRPLGTLPPPSTDDAANRAAVVAAARDLVAAVRELDPAWSPPPFEPERYARALGIPVVEVPGRDLRVGDRALDAVLSPAGGRFTILLNAGVRSPGRRRFSTAHEIVHAFFADAAQALRRRVDGRRPALERLVDAGAAELLMPAAEFSAALRRHGLGAAAVGRLAAEFAVSRAAAARRVAETATEPCAVAFLGLGRRPSGGGAVAYRAMAGRTFAAPGMPLVLPAGKSVAADSVIHRCSLGLHPLEAEEELPVGPRRVRVRVSAAPLHRDPTRVEGPPTVCAVVRPVSSPER